MARRRNEAYQRVVRVAREQDADEHTKMVSLALVAAIEEDGTLGRRTAFHEYMNRTVDANVQSETHVFHNAWYGYKNWGIGLACYATFYENPRAVEILRTLERDYLTRAAPALELAGAGGGWAEGYYIHYWLYEWLFFCEAARWCEGVDYYAGAPKFYRNRAIAGMFESYPGIGIYNSRRPVPIGDGGHYDGFGTTHDVNFHLRSIAHNTILVHDPASTCTSRPMLLLHARLGERGVYESCRRGHNMRHLQGGRIRCDEVENSLVVQNLLAGSGLLQSSNRLAGCCVDHRERGGLISVCGIGELPFYGSQMACLPNRSGKTTSADQHCLS